MKIDQNLAIMTDRYHLLNLFIRDLSHAILIGEKHYEWLAIFREEVMSALADFYASLLSWSNWNLEMLVFTEGGKPKNPENNPLSNARTNEKLNLHMAPGWHRTLVALVILDWLI